MPASVSFEVARYVCRSDFRYGGISDIAAQHELLTRNGHRQQRRRRHRAVHLSAPGAVRHDVAHQVANFVLQISDDVLDDVSNRDHAHDLARVQHW